MLTVSRNFILTGGRLRYPNNPQRYPQSLDFAHLYCVVMAITLDASHIGGLLLGQRVCMPYDSTGVQSHKGRETEIGFLTTSLLLCLEHRKSPLCNVSKHKPCSRIFGNWEWNHWSEFVDCGLEFGIQRYRGYQRGFSH